MRLSDSGIIMLGFAVALMVGIFGAGIRAVLRGVRRGGQVDFWNIDDR